AAEELHAITDNPLFTDAISFLSTPFSLDDAQALIRDHFNDRERFYGIRALHNMQLVGVERKLIASVISGLSVIACNSSAASGRSGARCRRSV
ncbi:MAG: hypothetical protein ACLPKT_09360, partial [Methylocella sp.]